MRVTWSPQELLIAFRLYCRTPFGKLHRANPEIVKLAQALRRTPSALAMKACNFASLDPTLKARNIRALSNVSRADRALWSRFEQDPEAVALEAETAYAQATGYEVASLGIELETPPGPSEIERLVRVRRLQGFFRDAVLISYENRCALSGMDVPELLNASHIIPWSTDDQRRADPRNGIALNVLYDRAFDRGLITFDEDLRVVLSKRLFRADAPPLHRHALLDLEGRKLQRPARFAPDPEALAFHRDHIFRDG
jgi:putative restriction endonuclease